MESNIIFAIKLTDLPGDAELGVETVLNADFVEEAGVDSDEFMDKLNETAFRKCIDKAVDIYVRTFREEMEDVENDKNTI